MIQKKYLHSLILHSKNIKRIIDISSYKPIVHNIKKSLKDSRGMVACIGRCKLHKDMVCQAPNSNKAPNSKKTLPESGGPNSI